MMTMQMAEGLRKCLRKEFVCAQTDTLEKSTTVSQFAPQVAKSAPESTDVNAQYVNPDIRWQQMRQTQFKTRQLTNLEE